MEKAPDAFRTISEVSEWLDTPTHVLRFWESRFPEVAPVKRAGGRRYYRVEDMLLLGGIKKLLHEDGVTIKALQDRIKSDGAESVAALSPKIAGQPEDTTAGDTAAEAESEPKPQDAATPVKPAQEETPPQRASLQRTPPQQAEPTAAEPPARSEPSARPRADAPVRARQRSLSLGDVPSTPEAKDESASEPAPSGVSFQRHPARTARREPTKSTPKDASRSHPTRPGLFVYDDSALHSTDQTAASEPVSETPPKASLGPIDGIPEDVGDDCAAPHAVPAPADLRALVALVSRPLPMAAVNTLSRLRALDTRWN